MSKRNKGWKPWARDAGSLIFGWNSKPKRQSNSWADRKRREVQDDYDVQRSLFSGSSKRQRNYRRPRRF